MNDENFAVALLVRVVDDLDPDVPALVSAGTQRGRVLRRRRRAVLGVASTALAAAGAFALGQLPNAAPDRGTAYDGDSAGAEDRRTLAVTPADLAPTLSKLLPGEEPPTNADDKGVTLPSGMMRAGVVWHGAAVSIGIDPSSEDRTPGILTIAELQAFLDGHPIDGLSSPDERTELIPAGLSPQEWCEAIASRAADRGPRSEQRVECTSLNGGHWASWHSIADSSVDGSGGATNWEITYELYTADGYLIQVQAHGVRGVEDPATSPVLATEQLREIAESEAWFK